LREPADSPIIERTTAVLLPLIQVFALYVLVHGHHSPGGGFQAGVALGAGMILVALAFGARRALRSVSGRAVVALGALGLLLYVLPGLLALAGGGAFLDYGRIPFEGAEAPWRRYGGIFVVEAGVCVAVSATMLSIFYRLILPEAEG
jgi:multicomponent Na+:H+ antiporter subunit B